MKNNLYLLSLILLVFSNCLFSQDCNHLYGLCSEGGDDNLGAIFHIDRNTGNQVLDYSFTLTNELIHPTGELTLDSSGLMFGTTINGGDNDLGVIFQWNPFDNSFVQRIELSDSSMGVNPCGLMTLYDGKFYGMMTNGGNNNMGVIFEWDPVTNNFIKRLDFDGLNTGRSPHGSLTTKNGKFYGMTTYGGINDMGILFEWNPVTNSFIKKVDFDGISRGSDPYGSLTIKNDKFYGMTSFGGTSNCGIIFEWDSETNDFNKRFDFDNIPNGRNPLGSLVEFSGKFYGTAHGGSTDEMAGVLFEWNPETNTYLVKISFCYICGSNPSGPLASLTLKDGRFYGMTSSGGGYDMGTIFEWNPINNNLTHLISFSGIANGYEPCGFLTLYDEKLYGMTTRGGLNNTGILFEWEPSNNIFIKKLEFLGTEVYGSNPYGSLSFWNEKYYGMTFDGGIDNQGTLFEWEPLVQNYSKKIEFTNDNYQNGGKPVGELITMENKLFGMTSRGGNNDVGVIFDWDPISNQYNTLFSFEWDSQGGIPLGSLALKDGNLYGMTSEGAEFGMGTIFEWNPINQAFSKKIVFDGYNKGAAPKGSLSLFDGKFYGMTSSGGEHGMGVIFDWDPVNNVFTKRVDFDGEENGATPLGSLTLINGKFYGMTTRGGLNNKGVLFEWNPNDNVYTKKIDFNGASNGAEPQGSLSVSNGKLYGMTTNGGINNLGVIFEFNPITTAFIKLLDFDKVNGSHPKATHFASINYSTPSINITACDSYEWLATGLSYTQTGIYSVNLNSISGCDSIITLNLVINNSVTSYTTINTCSPYTWNDSIFSMTGIYSIVYHGGSIHGCDSTAVLNLTINNNAVSTSNITSCDSYAWNDTIYTASGVYSHYFPNGSFYNCDSTAVLNLDILQSTSSISNLVSCESYEWNDNLYTSSGIYYKLFQGSSANGCDSTATLNLTIIHGSNSYTEITTCDSIIWNGNLYSSSGTYSHIFNSGGFNGCDSTAILNLQINPSTSSISNIQSCGSYIWNDNLYTNSGLYTKTFTLGSSIGCDSTAVLNLTINPLPLVSLSGPTDVCQSSFNNIYSTQPGMSNYSWIISEGGIVTAGGTINDNSIQILWNSTGPQFVSVNYYDSNSCSQNNPDTLLIEVEQCKTLNVKLFLEGLYAGRNSMYESLGDNGPRFGVGVADQVTLELRSSSNYDSTIFVANNISLNTSGNATLLIPNNLSSFYYITIKNRNHIETTSALPVSFMGNIISYVFSNSVSKAFGNNMVNLSGVFAIWGGDENQDGIVDASDMIDIENNAFNFVTGYINTDLNGDGLIDAGDMILADNNANSFVASILPNAPILRDNIRVQRSSRNESSPEVSVISKGFSNSLIRRLHKHFQHTFPY